MLFHIYLFVEGSKWDCLHHRSCWYFICFFEERYIQRWLYNYADKILQSWMNCSEDPGEKPHYNFELCSVGECLHETWKYSPVWFLQIKSLNEPSISQFTVSHGSFSVLSCQAKVMKESGVGEQPHNYSVFFNPDLFLNAILLFFNQPILG